MTQSISAIASNVVGQYTQVGKIIVGAYRSGTQRLAHDANTRYVSFLKGDKLPLVSDDAKASLIKVQAKINDVVVGGINTNSDRAEKAIDFVAGGVNGGIKRVAATAGRVESALDTSAITAVGQYAILPVAQVSLAIATRAVEGTKFVAARVVGAEADVAKTVVKAKRVVKKAAARAKTVAKAKTVAVRKTVRAKAR